MGRRGVTGLVECLVGNDGIGRATAATRATACAASFLVDRH